MSDRDIGQEILEGIKEIKRFNKGEIALKTHTRHETSHPSDIRHKLELSKSAFASLMGVTPPYYQELGARKKKTSRTGKIAIAYRGTASRNFYKASMNRSNNSFEAARRHMAIFELLWESFWQPPFCLESSLHLGG